MDKNGLINTSEEGIEKDYTEDFIKYGTNAFSKFVQQKRKEYNELHPDQISATGLAEKVGVKYEVFRKIVNESEHKVTKKRDFILAIGFVLGFEKKDYETALKLYPGMCSFNDNDKRDMFIATYSGWGWSIKRLNRMLKEAGFYTLDIHNSRGQNSDSREEMSVPYNVLSVKTYTPISDIYYYGDMYNSLCTTYDPANCKCMGKMLLENTESDTRIMLIIDRDEKLYSYVNDDLDSYKEYDTLDDTGDYKGLFVQLNNVIEREHNHLWETLNDTKNYQERTSARLIGNHITIFSEEYNYTVPELNEYYVMTLSAGNYKLGIFHESDFMYLYLPWDEYKKYYSTHIPEAVASYDSEKLIQEMLESSDPRSENALKLRLRLKAFGYLKGKVDSLYDKLKNHTKFIRNHEYIYEFPSAVFEYYDLVDDYHCIYDDENPDIITDHDKSKEYTLPDGSTVEIMFDDIKRAFELGFDNIEQICQIKAEYGSIDAVL